MPAFRCAGVRQTSWWSTIPPPGIRPLHSADVRRDRSARRCRRRRNLAGRLTTGEGSAAAGRHRRFSRARTAWKPGVSRTAAQGRADDAQAALGQLRAIASDPNVAPLRMEFNTSGTVLGVAAEVLAGHVAAAKGDMAAAAAHLGEAARLEDALTYGEPPEWSVPVRQELGMMLLRADRAADAEQAFREDLKRFPDNGWSLRGLELALREQGRTAEADQTKAQLDKSWSSADVPPPGPARRN